MKKQELIDKAKALDIVTDGLTVKQVQSAIEFQEENKNMKKTEAPEPKLNADLHNPHRVKECDRKGNLKPNQRSIK